MTTLELSRPQHIYLNELNTKFRAYTAGFGSGKTFIGCLDLLLFMLKHRGYLQGYFGPSYPAIRDIFYPTIEEAASLLGLTCKFALANKEVSIYAGREYLGTIICRSMEHPETIVGFKIVRGVADELDVLKPEKAKVAWNKMIARLRQMVDGVVNGLGVTTTPEGFNFVYNRFVKERTKSYSMVQASTYENLKNLPDDYIDSLLETYPEQLARAYINGEFVNLQSGSIYSNFDRKLNATQKTCIKNDVLYIGMDFNVNKMAAIIHVKENDKVYAVDEICNVFDTPEMIRIIKSRYPDNKTIRVYPDASGKSRKTNDASTSDIQLLEQAGFSVVANKKNPAVKDRILAMQLMFLKGDTRRYFVNVNKCPTYADNLEQQVYNQAGEPDKSQDKDHTNDAAGYFIAYDYPVVKPVHNLKVNFSF